MRKYYTGAQQEQSNVTKKTETWNTTNFKKFLFKDDFRGV